MAEVLYPTSTEVEGPLLIDRRSLEQLDSILNEHWKRLVNQQDAIEERSPSDTSGFVSVDSEWLKHHLASQRRRVLAISFADGRTLRVQSFSEAFAHAEIINELPVEFELRMVCGGIECEIGAEADWRVRLRVKISPQENEAVRDFFGDIKSWLRTIKPSAWLTWWRKTARVSFLIWMAWLAVSAGIVGYSVSATPDYKDIARQIVAKGVTSENRDQALQAILAIEAEYGSPKFRPRLGVWIFVVGGFIACMILSYPPTMAIGMGKGEQRVFFWKTWIRIVFIFIPLFIASNILAPLLVGLISKKLGP